MKNSSKDKKGAPSPSKPGKKKIRVNFEGVETRGKVEDGKYHAKVSDVTEEEGQKYPYLKWEFELMEEGVKGRKVYTNTSLSPQSLWNLRNLLECLGIEVPDSEVDLDLKSFVGLELVVRVENEVYEGKERPKVTDYEKLGDTAEVQDDESSEDGETEEGDGETEEEGDGDTETAEEETEETAEEEEEEEDKITRDQVMEMDEKELAELVRTHSLKVNLSKIDKKGKKISAVLDALEKAGLLAE